MTAMSAALRRDAVMLAAAVTTMLLSGSGCVSVEPTRAERARAAAAPQRAVEADQFGTPAAGAPAGLAQFGRLVGRWECAVDDRGADGRWHERPDTAIWTWFYSLGGLAIQDVWEPRRGGGAAAVIGTNLRLYDPREDLWRSVWTSTDDPRFELWQGAAADGRIVMLHGDAGVAQRRIVFFDLTPRTFAWHYELRSDGAWNVALRSLCRRIAGQP